MLGIHPPLPIHDRKRTGHSLASPASGLGPSLIILGAQKAASTFLFDALASHPQCQGADPKEPSYFSRWDQVRSDSAWSRYCELFRDDEHSKHAVTFEATTAYLSDPQAPLRMRERLADSIRFVAILRNPADRCVSAYWHMYKRGDDLRTLSHAFANTGSNLDEAIVAERNACDEAVRKCKIDLSRYEERYDDPAWPARYIANSAYLPALQRHAEVFGKQSLRVVFFEDLLAEPERIWHDLCRFLGIETRGSSLDINRASNPTRVPRHTPAARLLRMVHRGALEQTTRSHAATLHTAITHLKFAPKPSTPPPVASRLDSLFRSHNRALAEWLDTDLPDAWHVG